MSEEKDTTFVPLFGLEQWQLDDISKFQADHGCKIKAVGAAGGKYTWVFGPTNLGTSQVVKCACGATIDVTDLEAW